MTGRTSHDPFLLEAEELLEHARQHNQEYQFTHADAAIEGVEQKLVQYEQRKQGSESLQRDMQELLKDVQNLGENDPQSAKLGG